MCPTSARSASTICVDYGTYGAHWPRSLPRRSCTPSWRPALTTVTLSSLGLQRSSPTSCSECSNSAARVVSGTRKFDRGLRQLIHCELHWLDIPELVKYKLGVITRRCLYGSAPQYLAECCVPVSTTAYRQHFRSAASHHLVIPSHRLTTYGRRAFSLAGPMFFELTAQTPVWPVTYWCCFGAITKNISFLRVLVYTVHQRHLRRCAI